ncbi:hypothetical protein [Pseudalkalibacillus caeni]|uniref:Uncharacterized protein n=1 Tax=Exobacillus caeni TaxID=2574798 RepID=A0A5R9F0M6_9BACL|nr:hypothetical protein [Pseudalkalibacillus caeni]TLS37182.1 hypothetical protein FCL54_11690 [Pseudalkalibacillus caeni]
MNISRVIVGLLVLVVIASGISFGENGSLIDHVKKQMTANEHPNGKKEAKEVSSSPSLKEEDSTDNKEQESKGKIAEKEETGETAKDEPEDKQEADSNESSEKIYDGPIAKWVEKIDYEDAVKYRDGQEEKAKKLVQVSHNYLNDTFAYGRLDETELNNLIEGPNYPEWSKFQDDVAWLRGYGFTEDSRVYYDMMNVEGLFYSVIKGDKMAVRYIHRIFHDLDKNINNSYPDTKEWGVTEAFGDNYKKVEDYVAGDVETDE